MDRGHRLRQRPRRLEALRRRRPLDQPQSANRATRNRRPSQELKDALIQAVTAWFESARHENPEARYKPPANVANRAPVPRRLITLNSYAVELTARASNLAWTLHLGENPTQSLQDLLDTAESFRKPQDIPQPTKAPKTQKAKEPPPDARVDAVKSELIIICRPLRPPTS